MATVPLVGDDFRTGYTAGGGIEYAMPTDSFFNFFKSSAVTLKVEGLYVNLDQENGRGARSVYNPRTDVLSLSSTAREDRVRRRPRRPELQVRILLGLSDLHPLPEHPQPDPTGRSGHKRLRSHSWGVFRWRCHLRMEQGLNPSPTKRLNDLLSAFG